MKIYDTNYGPDTFGRVRMGLITEMFLTFDGFMKPEIGDHLRISCVFKGVVRDVYTVVITQVCDCVEEPETVLIRVEKKQATAPKIQRVDEFSSFTAADMPVLTERHTLH
jgi:hypothetical protein